MFVAVELRLLLLAVALPLLVAVELPLLVALDPPLFATVEAPVLPLAVAEGQRPPACAHHTAALWHPGAASDLEYRSTEGMAGERQYCRNVQLGERVGVLLCLRPCCTTVVVSVLEVCLP